jgi:hypothetical protein
MVVKDLRAAWRTVDEGWASDDDSKSEIEFTKGMAGLMIRCGNAVPNASTKYWPRPNSRVTGGHFDLRRTKRAVAKLIAPVLSFATDFCDTKNGGKP